MPEHGGQRPLLRGPDIKRPNRAIDTRSSKNSRAILVPIVGECFGGRGRPAWLTGDRRHGGGGVDGYLGDEVVRCGGWGAKIKDAHI